MKLGLKTAVLILAVSSYARAQVPAGRWHVQTTSGDQPAQTATGEPVAFDTAVDCFMTSCGGKDVSTFDTSVCDTVKFENISSGFVMNGSTAAFQFAVSSSYQESFIYTFVGTLAETTRKGHGANLVTSATVTGTYGSTPGGCNNGTSADQGTFVAHWYPPITGTYFGRLFPDNQPSTNLGIELAISQGDYGALTGTVTTGQVLRNPRTGLRRFVAIQNPCFSSVGLTLAQNDPGTQTNDAAGNQFFIYAEDDAGNSLRLSGVADEIGSNTSYSVSYQIVGGPCSGQTGTKALLEPLAAQSTPVGRPILDPRSLDPPER